MGRFGDVETSHDVMAKEKFKTSIKVKNFQKSESISCFAFYEAHSRSR